ncbi:unnamed protein product [Thlaspi arvense]|uniref:Uncharacterized protein n=1 Tax=Thlaspi arvense TaxID=13288 RepID=A0AAU9RXW8_THLAR|nr:unnamed protein product [Thlaspi arvense]
MKILHFLAPNSAKPAIINLKQQYFGAITQTQIVFRRNKRQSLSINCSNSGSNNGGDEKISQPLDGVEIRFRRGSRRKMREEGSGEGGGQKKKAETSVQKPWEEMTLNEKALELYVGEKGLLFWLNKLAYASIYIVIGGWILFRFVGPALNLYQLDTPPLDPKNILKG